jgi:tetratricopeptide (TPR) repeat protein
MLVKVAVNFGPTFNPRPQGEAILMHGEKPEDILEGWKAIAEYLRLTDRTVQRWEKSRGLPVRRFKGDSAEEQSRVFAYRSEIDAWWRQNTPLRQDEENGFATSEAMPPVSTVRLNLYRRRMYLLLAVILAAVVVALTWPRIENWFRPSQAKVGVVPIRNLGGAGDPEPQHLAEGLTEELISELGHLHPARLGVIGLSPSAGGNSKLDYRLEGTVRRAGSKVAITAQLIQVKDQTLKWGNSYERDLNGPQDMIPIEIEIRDAITKEVLAVLPKDVHPIQQVSREAYEAYLYGRFFWNKRTTESLFKAKTYFESAIGSDPSYAPAYAGLADCYSLLGSVPYTALPPNQAFPKSEEAARKALQIDKDLAEAKVSLGFSALVYRRDYPEAEKQFQEAVRLRPDYAPAHQFYAYYLTAMGRMKEAIQERQVARDLDPLSPLLNAALGEAYYQDRQFDRGIEQNQKSLQLDAEYSVALMNIARAYEQKHTYTQAHVLLQKMLVLAPEEPVVLALAGHEYAVSGHPQQARSMLSRLQKVASQRYVPPLYFALMYIGLGDRNKAFQALDQAYEERSEYLVYLPTEPLADPLRSDPRFPQLLKRLGLTAPAISAAAR